MDDSRSLGGVGDFFHNARIALDTEISIGILASFLLLMPAHFRLYRGVEYAQSLVDSNWDTDDKFDFIIVGGGSAGAVVANRLSENFKVLLLEAGCDPNPWHRVPILALPFLKMPQVAWDYYTVPQENGCQAMNSQKSFWPRGRSIGGSSNTNFLTYHRGHKFDYQRWSTVTGDPRWKYENVLQMFKKSENYSGDWNDDQFHGHDGYLQVSKPPYTGMADLYCKAAGEIGIPTMDLNGAADYTEGCDIIHNTQEHGSGKRHDTFNAFILPVRNRSSLTIRKFSQVTKIIFEGADNRADGVEYTRHGKTKITYSSKEVILSAGAINSPQILMLSGIGPKEHLESLNISVLVDLPVGKNLQDHVYSLLGPFIVDNQTGMNFDRDTNLAAWSEFFSNGSGVFTSSAYQASSFLVSEMAKSLGQNNWPDIQHIAQGLNIYRNIENDYSESFNIKRGVLAQFFDGSKDKESFQIMNILVHPHSKGEITLESSNPRKPPLIDPKYFDQGLDLKVLVEGAKRAVDLVGNAPTFKEINARLHNTSFPGCDDFEFRSDAYWRCHHRQYTLTMHSPVGTCAMGKPDSKEAVVDPELRVIGTKNLRVVDASIMPFITTGPTNAPTIMIGEMGADMILKAWS